MGGFGSGPVMGWSNQETTEDYRSIDIRKWKREGLLDGYQTWRTHWTINGEESASIRAEHYQDRITLSYGSREYRGEWVQIRTEIAVTRTPCHLGGSRVWFRCPDCGRRVAKLYGGKFFLCRHCHNLPYRSQRENELERFMRRANHYFDQIRKTDDRMCLDKPKGMHWKTYWRLYHKGVAEMSKAKRQAAFRWGSWGSEIVEDSMTCPPVSVPT